MNPYQKAATLVFRIASVIWFVQYLLTLITSFLTFGKVSHAPFIWVIVTLLIPVVAYFLSPLFGRILGKDLAERG